MHLVLAAAQARPLLTCFNAEIHAAAGLELVKSESLLRLFRIFPPVREGECEQAFTLLDPEAGRLAAVFGQPGLAFEIFGHHLPILHPGARRIVVEVGDGTFQHQSHRIIAAHGRLQGGQGFLNDLLDLIALKTVGGGQLVAHLVQPLPDDGFGEQASEAPDDAFIIGDPPGAVEPEQKVAEPAVASLPGCDGHDHEILNGAVHTAGHGIPGLQFPDERRFPPALELLHDRVDGKIRLAALGLQVVDLAPGIGLLRQQQAGLGKLKLFSQQG
ncbi:MAG: hypothetical protein BWY77_01219 [bacterium ADurb.Bin431]|nr:MAG: hypothetical protein BWY77_01219 [bacterium ADurb.Bin431]